MAVNAASQASDFQPARAQGWRLGFRNLLSRENRKWWGRRRWLVQALLWSLVLDGFLVMALFVIPSLETATGQPVIEEDPLMSAVQGFFSLSAVALAIGISVLAQDEIIGEKQSGTAEWVLSKPASRSAFILSKLAANTGGLLAAMIGIPSLLAYALLWAAGGSPYPPAPFLSGVGIVFLHGLFYLILTLTAGVLAQSRSAVLAVSLGSILGGSFLRNFIAFLGLLTPWMLPDIAAAAGMGNPIPPLMFIPIAATGLWSVVLLMVALWKFQRYEF